MSVTSQSLLDYLYDRKLPQIYRDEDRKIGYPLKRYLKSLIEGGFSGSIEDIKGVMFLIDPETIPEKFFPYLCESFGLTYFPDIDVSYQRRFLANVGELNKRRGTFSSVHFLIRVLTGLDSRLSYRNGTLIVSIRAKSLEQVENIETSLEVIGNYVKTQIPYFVDTLLIPRIETQVIPSKSYSHSVVGVHKSYTISQYKEG